MPTLPTKEAAEKIARGVEQADPRDLGEIYREIFPQKPPTTPPTAEQIARLIRDDLGADMLVDLWNVVFPDDHYVWYNEATGEIHYNEELAEYAD